MKALFFKSIFAKFFLLTFILFLCACGGGGGGGGSGNGSGGAEDLVPDFQPAEIISQSSETISADAGGTIEHNGAALIIPPGALSETATLTLAATTLPSRSLPENDGALLDQKVLGSEGFVIGVDRDIQIDDPITLRLPIDSSLIPDNSDTDPLAVCTDVGGYLIIQARPTRSYLDEGYIEWDLWPNELYAMGSNRLLGQPHAVGVPFLILLATLGGTQIINPLIATLDFLNGRRFDRIHTDNFRIFYNPSLTNATKAFSIGDDLEKAYPFFRDLGFSLPNWINVDRRCTVVIDDLKAHYLLKGKNPEGLTLPGSTLFEGAIYVNAGTADAPMPMQVQKDSAVHEYFHALQYGALDSLLISNLLDKNLNAQSEWLFEGSTTIMTGRLQYGNGTAPHRDDDDKRLKAAVSLYDPDQDPGDRAQDFFYYLERQLGHVDFYLPTFQALGPNPIDSRERAVRALDEVLQDMTNGALHMETAWRNFIVDYWIDNIRLYPTGPIPEQEKMETVVLKSKGDTASTTINLPSLSYYLVRFYVPKLDKDKQGNIIPDQLRDVEIETSLPVSSDWIDEEVHIEFVDKLSPTAGVRTSAFVASGDDQTHIFEDFRTEDRRLIIAVISNSSTDTSSTAALSFTAKLSGEPPDDDGGGEAQIQVIGVQNRGEALINQPTAAQINNADIQLSGDPRRPTISWNFSGAIAVSVQGGETSEGMGIFKYGIQGIEEETSTGQTRLATINSPVRYGDYSISRTEPIDDFLVPSPDLDADILGAYSVYVMSWSETASIAFILTSD